MSEFNMHQGAFMGETSPGKESQVFPLFYRSTKYRPVIPGVRDAPESEPVDMVEIRQAGEKDFTREEVNEYHRRRWPAPWAQYQAGVEQSKTGTPIELLFPGQAEIAAEMKRFNVHSVEALANVPDSSANIIPFLTDRKKQAAAFLEHHKRAEGFDELRGENEKLAKRLEEMEALLATVTDPERRGPGRPRKVETLETQEN
ncbi:hypothetical protein [Shinella sp.]|uniref:hypothetical protein n=1 Tax=Shinella sp. TaxID=1870904 RepID=UPI003D268362